MKTKQIIFTAPNTAQLLDAEYLPPKPNQVTVALAYSAISSGTEKANLTGVRNSPTISEDAASVFPRTVGYSASGIVTEIGSDVDNLQVGDRVVVAWGKHKKNITLNAANVVKIPDSVSLQEASMALISTFPLGAIRKTRLEIGESAMVMGLGILGIFAVQELRAAGAYPVIAVDPVASRREFALKMGADAALDPAAPDFYDAVKRLSNGGVQVCIEVTGLGIGLTQALDCMQRFGRVALLGCTRSSDFKVDFYGKVHGPGISLIGAHTMARPKQESSPGFWTDRDDISAVLKLIEGKRLNFKDMICQICVPEDAPQVYSKLVSDPNFPIGVLFDWTDLKF